MAEVDTIIEDPRWLALDLAALVDRAMNAALGHLDLGTTGWEISLLGCDDARIAALNADFRGRRGPTNVLSWPAQERGPGAEGAVPEAPAPTDPELGDIAIAWETCAAEAEDAGKPMADHVTHLFVHGLLHLLGYDHMRDGDAALMERLEAEILGKLGLPDPYCQE